MCVLESSKWNDMKTVGEFAQISNFLKEDNLVDFVAFSGIELQMWMIYSSGTIN